MRNGINWTFNNILSKCYKKGTIVFVTFLDMSWY